MFVPAEMRATDFDFDLCYLSRDSVALCVTHLLLIDWHLYTVHAISLAVKWASTVSNPFHDAPLELRAGGKCVETKWCLSRKDLLWTLNGVKFHVHSEIKKGLSTLKPKPSVAGHQDDSDEDASREAPVNLSPKRDSRTWTLWQASGTIPN